jgi:hypothetical protein
MRRRRRLPGLEQEWHWGFYSCSGFSFDVSLEEQRDKWGGGHGLWPDVLARHQQLPLHLMVGRLPSAVALWPCRLQLGAGAPRCRRRHGRFSRCPGCGPACRSAEGTSCTTTTSGRCAGAGGGGCWPPDRVQLAPAACWQADQQPGSPTSSPAAACGCRGLNRPCPADPAPGPPPPHHQQVPSLKAWLRIEPHSERYSRPASSEMGEQCEAYYFHHYMRHFGEGPVGQVYRTIPQARSQRRQPAAPARAVGAACLLGSD